MQDLNELVLFLKNNALDQRIIRFSNETKFGFSFQLNNKKILHLNANNNKPFCFIFDKDSSLTSIESNQFIDKIKKYCVSAFIRNISQANNDNIILFELTKTNEFYERKTIFLIFEMIIFHPNIIVTDEKMDILFALKETDVLAKRPICKGIKFTYPKNNSKTNFEFNFNTYCENAVNFRENMKNIHTADKSKEIAVKLKTKAKTLQRKIEKLRKEIRISEDKLIYKEAADYLNFNRNEEINDSININDKEIKLDKSKSLNENIQRFYKIYKKAKASKEPIEQQINLAQCELDYLNSLINSIPNLSDDEIDQIKIEFNIRSNTKTSKNIKRHITIYKTSFNGATFYYGKNAYQNEYISFELAGKNDTWMHIQGFSGSHLIIKKDAPVTKEDLQIGCEIIAYLFNKNDGNVQVSLRKHISKGSYPGQVMLRKYEEFHINKISQKTIDIIKNSKATQCVIK